MTHTFKLISGKPARSLIAPPGHQCRPTVAPRGPLIAQRALIARMASRGASNPEIAAQLFISRATAAITCGKCSSSSASPRATSWQASSPAEAMARPAIWPAIRPAIH
jgi:hypothetical protein